MLLLDCTKGYNLLSREWVIRVLRQARLPVALINVVTKLMVNDSVLMINGKEWASFLTKAGLTQGCPASCFLYIIAVDPLLCALNRVDGIRLVSGFVDDWSAACSSFGALRRAGALIREFERASGQVINREKSAVVPSRRLSASEMGRCYAEWGWQLRISYRERLLGIFLGLDAGIEEQYKIPLEKLTVALQTFTAARHMMGIVARILTVNVFLNTLFSYVNRMFFMPARVLKDVERRILDFITPLPWTKLGLFVSLKDLYGINCGLVDLRNSNVASVLATYERAADMKRDLCHSVSRWRTGRRLVHPAVSWGSAFGYFAKSTQHTYADALHEARRRRTSATITDQYRVLYKSLCHSDLPRWRDYLAARVAAKGWAGDALL